MDVFPCLQRLAPTAQFRVKSNDYNRVVWDPSNTAPKPTLAQCEAAWQEIQAEQPMKLLRQERNRRLVASDLYAIVDFPHPTDTEKQAWLAYRQALRDLPSTASPQIDANGALTNVTWPTSPS